jgi:hypothetical protein
MPKGELLSTLQAQVAQVADVSDAAKTLGVDLGDLKPTSPAAKKRVAEKLTELLPRGRVLGLGGLAGTAVGLGAMALGSDPASAEPVFADYRNLEGRVPSETEWSVRRAADRIANTDPLNFLIPGASIGEAVGSEFRQNYLAPRSVVPGMDDPKPFNISSTRIRGESPPSSLFPELQPPIYQDGNAKLYSSDAVRERFGDTEMRARDGMMNRPANALANSPAAQRSANALAQADTSIEFNRALQEFESVLQELGITGETLGPRPVPLTPSPP